MIGACFSVIGPEDYRPVAQSHGFRLQVDSAARFGDPYSPTHRLTLNRNGDRLELTLPDTAAGGDLEVFLPLARGLLGMSLVGDQPAGEGGHFMLPPAPRPAAQNLTPHPHVVPLPHVSGS